MFESNGIKLLNVNNMEFMKTVPDKFFDWGVIDPPYGLGDRLSDGGGKLKNTPMAVLYRTKDWDELPNKRFWDELFRITKNQIVFGANYFLEFLPSSRGVVAWDKKQAMPTLSAFELVWTSKDKPAKIARISSMDLNRFHPTQKPIEIYEFMFDYCKIEAGSKIFDSHLGSGSSAVASDKMGFEFVGCEIDEEYFSGAVKRLKLHQDQYNLFSKNAI